MHPLSRLPQDTPHTECSYCDDGVAEREVDDYDADSGRCAFVAIGGSSRQDRFAWACPTCTARRIAEEAELGCNLLPPALPADERGWRFAFERPLPRRLIVGALTVDVLLAMVPR